MHILTQQCGIISCTWAAQPPLLLTMQTEPSGYDSAELVAGLRAKHYEGHHTWGLEMNKGALADMTELGICEAFKVKSQA